MLTSYVFYTYTYALSLNTGGSLLQIHSVLLVRHTWTGITKSYVSPVVSRKHAFDQKRKKKKKEKSKIQDLDQAIAKEKNPVLRSYFSLKKFPPQ